MGKGADEDDGTADSDGAGEGEEEGRTAGTGDWETTESRETTETMGSTEAAEATETTEAARATELIRLPGVVDLHGRTMSAGSAHNRLFRGASVSVTSCGHLVWVLRLGTAIGSCDRVLRSGPAIRNGDCSPVTC